MVNKVILVGNLTRDAKEIDTKGKAMAKVTVATNSSWKDSDGNRQEASEFHNVVCFGPIAETAVVHCSKGLRVYVEGRLRTREYEGDEGGRRFGTEVVAEKLLILGTRREAEVPEAVAS